MLIIFRLVLCHIFCIDQTLHHWPCLSHHPYWSDIMYSAGVAAQSGLVPRALAHSLSRFFPYWIMVVTNPLKCSWIKICIQLVIGSREKPMVCIDNTTTKQWYQYDQVHWQTLSWVHNKSSLWWFMSIHSSLPVQVHMECRLKIVFGAGVPMM
jgi:hypothetical protein